MRTAALAGALFAAIAAASDVHDLKKDNFEAFVKENDLVLAECKFCPLFASPCESALLTHTSTNNSLCPMVRTLQGPRPRV